MEEEKREEQRSRGGSLAPSGEGEQNKDTSPFGRPSARPALADWTPPAKQAAADCFIKLPQLGVRGGVRASRRPELCFQTHRFDAHVRAGAQGRWQETRMAQKPLLSIHGNGARLSPSLQCPKDAAVVPVSGLARCFN